MTIKLGDGEVILVVQPTPVRRAVSLLSILAIAGFLTYAGFSDDVDGLVWRIALIAMGVLMLVLAERFYRATAVSLELTREVLRDSAGRELFRIEDLVRVDRGAFAMKPSNGLSVQLKEPGPFTWEPGVWWRIGRRIGIGGATAPSQARAIADAIALIEAERDGRDKL